MAGYVEHIKVAGGEQWQIRDPEAPRKNEILDLIYPVGSIYLSVNSANPGTIIGGTWAQIKDKFLLAAGDKYKGGDEGGEETHRLTNEEMPSHTHTLGSTNGAFYYGTDWTPSTSNAISCGSTATNNWVPTTDASGGGQAHNNMPPYLAVYIWERTA